MIEIQGTYSFNITGDNINVQIERVANTSTTYTSGTIRFELWLSETQYFGGTLNGYQIAEIRLDDFAQGGDGRLSPGETFSSISFNDPFDENVPDGEYYFVLVVTEFQNSQTGFAIVDYGTFAEPDFIGDPPPVDNDIVGTSGRDTLEGTSGQDEMFGLAGSDVLLGSGANDTLYGGGGSDFLSGDAGGDRLFGGSGFDFADYLGAAQKVTANLNDPSKNAGQARGDKYNSIEGLLGSRFADKLVGSDRGNVLDGWAGNDDLFGRKGNDRMYGDAGRDELFGGGGRDDLYGGRGHDTLLGGNGRDKLVGRQGDDRLLGGRDRDVMEGGSGADRFVFQSARETGLGSEADRIKDFGLRSGDRIDLRGIDANENRAGNQDFRFIGSDGFSGAAGEVRYSNGYVRADTDGDRRADFMIEVDIVDGSRLFAGDFIL